MTRDDTSEDKDEDEPCAAAIEDVLDRMEDRTTPAGRVVMTSSGTDDDDATRRRRVDEPDVGTGTKGEATATAAPTNGSGAPMSMYRSRCT